MFGVLRYLLALMVMQSHIWKIVPWGGHYAVFAFYILSGYLMTLVLNEKYPFSARGMWGYFCNRVLRIYPPYLVALALSVFVVHYVPRMAVTVHKDFSMPVSQLQWLKNIFIIGAYHPSVSSLVITAWSLHVELIFYALMGLGLSRNRWIAFGWFAVSLAYTVMMTRQHPTEHQFWYYRYFPLEAASLPFSIGACAWYLRKVFRGKTILATAAGVLFIAHLAGAGSIWKGADAVYRQGFYTSMALGALAVLFLGGIDTGTIPRPVRSLDRMLGNMAYPVFLFHVQVSALILLIFFKGWVSSRTMLFLYSLPFIHIVAYAVYRGLEVRINVLRGGIAAHAGSKDQREPEINNRVELVREANSKKDGRPRYENT